MADSPRPVVRSPAVSPSRPLSIRHLSSDITTYIDMYGLDQTSNEGTGTTQMDAVGSYTEDDFIASGDVGQELKNLQNLRRISLDVSKLDPDVPLQNYELSPALDSHTPAEDLTVGPNLYWVPARIHPELAPQEWQSFVQKKEFRHDNQALNSPSLGRGLSRSRSLLSREVNERAAEKYTDAGPELERRRSNLRPSISVPYLSTGLHENDESSTKLESLDRESSIAEETSADNASDEPILVPPPGQILRRAARTGKAKGSYRKFAKPKLPALTTSVLEDVPPAPSSPSSAFESETIQLRADAPGYVLSTSSGPADGEEIAQSSDALVERKKSRNRTIQIVGPKSPAEAASALEGPILLQPTTKNDSLPSQPSVGPSIPHSTTMKSDVGSISHETDTTENLSLSIDASDAKDPSHLDSVTRSASQDSQLGLDKLSHTSTKNATANEHSSTPLESPKTQSRPGLRRELSAASLTRAVMSGTAPMPAPTANRASRPEEQSQEASTSMTSNGKKSAWNKLFSSDDRDKSKSKKDVKTTTSKMKRSPSQEERTNHEKEAISTSIFTSIFGAKKKEKEVPAEPIRRETTPTPKAVVREPHFYSRYPIQLERAIYRMAHLKLGNSRRPLFHQVLLSNFMYGYLALVGANASGQATGPSNKRNRSQGSMQRAPSAREDAEARTNNRSRVMNNDGTNETGSQIQGNAAAINHKPSDSVESSMSSQDATRSSDTDQASARKPTGAVEPDKYANKENSVDAPHTNEKSMQRLTRRPGHGQRSMGMDAVLQQQ